MKKQSITTRFLKYIICMILASNLLLFFVTYSITHHSMEQQVIHSNRNLMESNIILLDRYFQDIDNIADSIIYNADVVEVLKNKQDTTAGMQLLYNIERTYYHSREDLSLIFYKNNAPQNSYSIYEGSGSTEWGDFRNSFWYDKIDQTGANRVIVTNSGQQAEGDERNQFVHTMVYRVHDIYSRDTVGYLRIDMDLSNLQDYLMPGYENIDRTVILDENQTVLFSDQEAVSVPEEVLEGLRRGAGDYQDNKQIITYGVADSVGWGIAFSVSKARMFMGIRQIVPVFWLMLVVVLGLTLAGSRKLFSIVTENFKRLIKGMAEVKEGNLSARVEVDRQDEIGDLILEFNDMVRQVDELVVKIEKNQILLNQAEIKALQQQINPHFIFNILETIMGLSSAGLDEKVISVCGHLSSMLRYNITFQNSTRLVNEIIQMKNYMEIIRIRFEDRFEVWYDIDEECLQSEMIKFTLQPLVENAVNHGLGDVTSGGIIRIRVKREDEQVSISIFDNGAGIGEERLLELNSQLHDTYENPLDYIDQYKSLGLLNVNLRLRMFFGDQYHMEIISKGGRGTCIYIKVPYRP